ncbi:MAG TPA: hypothetical protein VHR45_00675 [Thermoanaerobaculia bacterium]|nr:hypothetical protein [Thermoanaerobaculia bacterium]
MCERALKKAILHRKNALFFKTSKGAQVADLYMSLIHTCELNLTNWMPWNYQAHACRKDTSAPASAATISPLDGLWARRDRTSRAQDPRSGCAAAGQARPCRSDGGRDRSRPVSLLLPPSAQRGQEERPVAPELGEFVLDRTMVTLSTEQ